MEFTKCNWTKDDIKEFNKYLLDISEPTNALWTKKIYATNKPCLAIKIPVLKQIAGQIVKGDYASFLKMQTHKFIEDDILQAIIISKMKSFDEQKNMAVIYLQNVDSWVCTDTLKLKTDLKNFDELMGFVRLIYKSAHTFLRRFAFVSLLKFAKYPECINIFSN